MSWNKNTVNASTIEHTKSTLDNLKVSYKLETIAKVIGRGLNDTEGLIDEHGNSQDLPLYELRKLTYSTAHNERVILVDQMVRDTDCDYDDVIKTQVFDGAVPADFKHERTWDSEEGRFTDEPEFDESKPQAIYDGQ